MTTTTYDELTSEFDALIDAFDEDQLDIDDDAELEPLPALEDCTPVSAA